MSNSIETKKIDEAVKTLKEELARLSGEVLDLAPYDFGSSDLSLVIERTQTENQSLQSSIEQQTSQLAELDDEERLLCQSRFTNEMDEILAEEEKSLESLSAASPTSSKPQPS